MRALDPTVSKLILKVGGKTTGESLLQVHQRYGKR